MAELIADVSDFLWGLWAIGILMVLGVLAMFKRGDGLTMATLNEVEPVGSTTKSFGIELFTTYMLPFQVAGVLLLIAMLGVIFISNRTSKRKEAV